MDDFASKLVGKIDRIALPQRGRWVRQGQKVWTVYHDDKAVDMVSPIEGTISDINEAAAANPELARQDPYGDGWLVKVQAPDTKTNFRNLLGGVLARVWMEESATRLALQNAGGDGLGAGAGRRRSSRRPDGAPARERLGHADQRIFLS